jgi:membrane-associated phospholipid phosphatase
VLLGVHYPTDTTFGYLLGITAALAVVSIVL